MIWSFWLIIFRLLRSEMLKKFYWKYWVKKQFAEIVQCWQTLNKIHDKTNFAMSSKLILPFQKWDTGCTVSHCPQATSALWKISDTLHFALKNPGFKQKTEDKNVFVWFIQNPKITSTYPNNIGKTQVLFLLTCFCSANIVLILQVYCLYILF